MKNDYNNEMKTKKMLSKHLSPINLLFGRIVKEFALDN